MLGNARNDTLMRSYTSLLSYSHVHEFMAEVTSEVIGYCVKCRAKQTMKDPQSVTLKNGKPATKGTCSKCGTNMFRIGKIK